MAAANSIATRRLRREFTAIIKSPIPNVTAVPLESNILEWHFVIEGTSGAFFDPLELYRAFQQADYPLRPPSVMMCTPSGRFKTNRRLCLSMSDFHPESWNPMWSVSTILTGLYSFMLENAPTLGSIDATTEERRKLAKLSLGFNVRDETFYRIFPDLVELHESRVKAEPGAAPVLPGDAASAASSAAAADVADAMNPDAQPSAIVFLGCVGLTLALAALVASSLFAT